jgi:dTDP-4-dehydrorhamnose 3,5-epimerase
MFEVRPTLLPGCHELIAAIREDARGIFVKTVHADFFRQHGLRSDFQEQYYSVSHRHVLRGLHFQLPPQDHAKLVYCTSGRVLDAVVDVRPGPTYGRHILVELSGEKANMIYIPAGCAHGFLTLSDSATMVYNVTSAYSPQHDSGIRWDSAGIDWPTECPTVSDRDAGLIALKDFATPFARTG